ncbi:MAG TPA: 1-(5-phosphoribosyl)-5-[(5-phosphoribosylamino)methylideneamino] imidazole-4-carboxamide isomerase [Bacteroidota bacterium]|nr:1-(5-phosphoribosyl)-5-[(5-phosphoribosylamino)methylideneamino] imidazole-4-carboxamide isomerase [Bacteroidota bacterium]
MLLIYPAIEISHEACVQVVHGLPGSEHTYSVDPVEMAVLWRGENAKTLHVVDRDGVAAGTVVNREIIKRMVSAVDIPIQVGGGLRNFEEIRNVLDLGVYRVVIGTAAVEQPGLIERLVKEFGTRKIAIGIDTREGHVLLEGGRRIVDIDVLELAMRMKKIGVTRIVYGEQRADGERILGYDRLRELATTTNIRITSWGGAADYKDLVRIQELEKFGVDSIIVGRPLYENRFPCQALWRLNERGLTDLGPTRRP